MRNTFDILVVDDNQHQLNFVTRLLNFHGYQTHTINKSREVLNFLLTHPVRLILLDIIMPELDGLTLLKQIRSHQETASIPVVIYSGKFYDVDKKKAIALGANSFISKPSRGAAIIDEIKKFV